MWSPGRRAGARVSRKPGRFELLGGFAAQRIEGADRQEPGLRPFKLDRLSDEQGVAELGELLAQRSGCPLGVLGGFLGMR